MVNKLQEDRKRFFYPDEYENMLDYCNKNQRFLAKVLINTGARINEARGIKLNNLNSERRNLILEKTKVRAKRGEKIPEPRIIALSNQFFRYLKANLETHRFLSTNAFNEGIKSACTRAKIRKPEQFSAHKFKKTFGTWMIALGADMPKLAMHMGDTMKVLMNDYVSNDIFSFKDKKMMRTILGNLPDRFMNIQQY